MSDNVPVELTRRILRWLQTECDSGNSEIYDWDVRDKLGQLLRSHFWGQYTTSAEAETLRCEVTDQMRQLSVFSDGEGPRGYHVCEDSLMKAHERFLPSRVPPKTVETDTIISHGEGRFQIGEHDQLKVTDRESDVLDSFLRSPSMDFATLADYSKTEKAPRVLKQLCEKYCGIFAPAITLPGGKGKGGYRVSIRLKQDRQQ